MLLPSKSVTERDMLSMEMPLYVHMYLNYVYDGIMYHENC